MGRVFAFLFLVNFSHTTFAEEALVTRDHTCDQLNISLENDGYLKVQDGLFNLSTYFAYSDDYIQSKIFLGCDYDEILGKAYVRSKDKRSCRLGNECQRDFEAINNVISANEEALPF